MSYLSLKSIEENIDMVDIFRAHDAVMGVLQKKLLKLVQKFYGCKKVLFIKKQLQALQRSSGLKGSYG